MHDGERLFAGLAVLAAKLSFFTVGRQKPALPERFSIRVRPEAAR
jgi:hypothetical protein